MMMRCDTMSCVDFLIFFHRRNNKNVNKYSDFMQIMLFSIYTQVFYPLYFWSCVSCVVGRRVVVSVFS